MSKIMLVSAALILATPAIARPGAAVPRLDITQTCHTAANLGLAENQSFSVCMTDEDDARMQIAQSWSTNSAAAKSRCSAETTIGGSPSYVELYVCLDIDKSLSIASTPRTAR